MKIKRKYTRSLIGTTIAIISTLLAGVLLELIRESHLLSFHNTHTTKAITDTSTIQKITKETPEQHLLPDNRRLYWEHTYFKPLKKDSWNVIVRSFSNDYYLASQEIKYLCTQFPQFHFRLALTKSQDSIQKNYYAIYFGNGLSRQEAMKLISIAKQFNVAKDVYMVKQNFTSRKNYR